MSMLRSQPDRSAARAALKVASTKRVLVLLGALLGAVLAFAVSKAQPPAYEAQGMLFMSTSSAGTNSDLVRDARTQAQLLQAQGVARRTAAVLGTSEDYVAGHVIADASSTANTITVTATAQTVDAAVQLVSQTVASYQAVDADNHREVNQKSIDDLNGQLAALQKQVKDIDSQLAGRPSDPYLNALRTAALTQVQTLTGRRSDLAVTAAASSGTATFDPPRRAPAPVSPRPARSAAVGLILGALLAFAGAWAWAATRGRLDKRGRAAEDLGIPLLASISGERHAQNWIAGCRAAAAAIEMAVGGGVSVIAMTPGARRDVNTATVLTVASMLDATTRVLVVDADGAEGELTPGARGRLGFHDVVADGISPLDVIVTLGADSSGAQTLSVMPSGSLRAGQGALGFNRLSQMLQHLRASFDRILIVTPGVKSPDTAMLLSASEGVVACFTDATPLKDAARLSHVVNGLRVPLLGYLFEAGGARPEDATASLFDQLMTGWHKRLSLRRMMAAAHQRWVPDAQSEPSSGGAVGHSAASRTRLARANSQGKQAPGPGPGRAGPGLAVLDPGLPDELSKRSPLATAWRARPRTYPVHR